MSHNIPFVTSIVTLTLNRTLVAVLWLLKWEFSQGRPNKELILGQETQLAILEMSSCYFIYKGDCSLPLCGRLEGPLGLLFEQ